MALARGRWEARTPGKDLCTALLQDRTGERLLIRNTKEQRLDAAHPAARDGGSNLEKSPKSGIPTPALKRDGIQLRKPY